MKTGYHLLVILKKKDVKKSYWTRLTKKIIKNQYIQIDWGKWIDEDDEK
jgi:hypothetical protein